MPKSTHNSLASILKRVKVKQISLDEKELIIKHWLKPLMEKYHYPLTQKLIEAFVDLYLLNKALDLDDKTAADHAYKAIVVFYNYHEHKKNTSTGIVNKLQHFIRRNIQPQGTGTNSPSEALQMIFQASIPAYDKEKLNLRVWRELMQNKTTGNFVSLSLFSQAIEIESILNNENQSANKKLSLAMLKQAKQQLDIKASYKQYEAWPELANICHKYEVSNRVFEKCLSYKGQLKHDDNLPNICINDKELDLIELNKKKETDAKYYMLKLPSHDPHGFILGIITHCCQSIGGASEACVIDGMTRKNNGFYMLLKKKNDTNVEPFKSGAINYKHFDIVGQAYAWISEEGNLTMDSWENLRGANNSLSVSMLKYLAKKICQSEENNIARVTVGVGGKTPESIKKEAHTKFPNKILEGYAYPDSANQVVLAESKALLKLRQSLADQVDKLLPPISFYDQQHAYHINFDSLRSQSQIKLCDAHGEDLLNIIRDEGGDSFEKEDIAFLLTSIAASYLVINKIITFEELVKCSVDKVSSLSAFKNDPKKLLVALYQSSKSLQDNIVATEAAVSINGELLHYTSNKLRNDMSVALAAVCQNGMALEYVGDEITDKREVMLVALSQNGNAFKFVSPGFYNDRDLLLLAIRDNIDALARCSKCHLDDRSFVLDAVKINGMAISHVNPVFASDREIAIEVLKQNGKAFDCLDASFHDDKELLLLAIKDNPAALEKCNSLLLDNDLFMRSAIEINPLALRYVRKKLKNDKSFVLSAVAKNGCALAYASDRMRRNEEVVLTAVKNTCDATLYMGSDTPHYNQIIGLRYLFNNEELRASVCDSVLQLLSEPRNKTLAIDAIKKSHNAKAYGFVDDSLKGDVDVALAAVAKNSHMMRFIAKKFRTSKEFAIKALSQNGMAIAHIDNSLSSDSELILIALRQNNKAKIPCGCENDIYLNIASITDAKKRKNTCNDFLSVLRAKGNDTRILAKVKDNPEFYELLSVEVRSNKKLTLSAVARRGLLLQFANEELRSDPDVVLAAIKQAPCALEYADLSLRSNPEIVLAAIKKDSYALEYADRSLRSDPKFVLTAINQNKNIDLEFVVGKFKDYKLLNNFMAMGDEEKKQCFDKIMHLTQSNDEELVLETLKENSEYFHFIQDHFKHDKSFISKAVSHSADVLQYVDGKLKYNEEVVLHALINDPGSLKYLYYSMDNDDVFQYLASLSDPKRTKCCSAILAVLKAPDDKSTIICALQQEPWALLFADEAFCRDKDVILAAVSNHGLLLSYASEALRDDKEVVITALIDSADALELASEYLKKDDTLIAISKIDQDSERQQACESLLSELKTTKQLFLGNKAQSYSFFNRGSLHSLDTTTLSVATQKNDDKMVTKVARY